jgi:transposase
MIAPPGNTQIWIAAGITDLRRGFTGLSALVQTKLEKSPMSGQVFIFRGRRGDLVKLIWFDGDGLCLFQKRLERGKFIWPQATEGSVSLTRAQLSMLLLLRGGVRGSNHDQGCDRRDAWVGPSSDLNSDCKRALVGHGTFSTRAKWRSSALL